METSSTTIILVGIVCIILGFLASVLLNTLNEDSEPESDQPETPPGGKKGKYSTIARLWRDQKSGSLLVEVDGKTLISPTPLSDSRRQEIEQAARDFRTWLGMGLTPGQNNAIGNAAVVAGISSVTLTADQSVQTETGSNSGPTNQQPVKTAIVPAAITQAAVGRDSPTLAVVEKSIVMQIEDILQDMLAGTELDHKGIHLIEDPSRGVLVNIGSEQFVGIESVPYPEIKTVIRSAVTAWEKR
jgi:hypothetical protein